MANYFWTHNVFMVTRDHGVQIKRITLDSVSTYILSLVHTVNQIICYNRMKTKCEKSNLEALKGDKKT
jgi:hypothetical protein